MRSSRSAAVECYRSIFKLCYGYWLILFDIRWDFIRLYLFLYPSLQKSLFVSGVLPKAISVFIKAIKTSLSFLWYSFVIHNTQVCTKYIFLTLHVIISQHILYIILLLYPDFIQKMHCSIPIWKKLELYFQGLKKRCLFLVIFNGLKLPFS